MIKKWACVCEIANTTSITGEKNRKGWEKYLKFSTIFLFLIHIFIYLRHGMVWHEKQKKHRLTHTHTHILAMKWRKKKCRKKNWMNGKCNGTCEMRFFCSSFLINWKNYGYILLAYFHFISFFFLFCSLIRLVKWEKKHVQCTVYILYTFNHVIRTSYIHSFQWEWNPKDSKLSFFFSSQMKKWTK